MRISAKGRYALAAMTVMARQYDAGEYITILNIAEQLDISKIYLEQVFSLLKKAELVLSSKGAQGGYQLARMPEEITVLDILTAVEIGLFEQTQDTVPEAAPEIEKALRLTVFDALDRSVNETLEGITLADLVNEAAKHQEAQALMYYI